MTAMPAIDNPSDPNADTLLDGLSRPIVFVDLKTTGTDAVRDRITEIGVVEVSRAGIERWSVLVNPQTPVPPFIQTLTGIDDTLLRGQPLFSDIAEALAERLHGKLFVAHNARFDYGFLKNEFRRAGIAFRADVLCTVRLSRVLFPSVQRHGLDALISRMRLVPAGRHRALADADLLWQFWQKIHESYSADLIDSAIKTVIRRASLPPALPETALDAIPSTPGVYLFYGDDDALLYVGKSINLKQRVASHFSGDHRVAKDLRLSQEIRRIEYRDTVGELGALLLEAQLVKSMQPVHNRLLRRATGACSWQWRPGAAPVLVHAAKRDLSREPGLFGVYASRAKALAHMRHLADEHSLCHARLGLEKVEPGRGCFGFQVRKCAGVCVGHEDAREHDTRMRAALDGHRMIDWPASGAIALIERSEITGVQNLTAWHVVDRWCYLGSCHSADEISRVIAEAGTFRPFDADVYALLARKLDAGAIEFFSCDQRAILDLVPVLPIGPIHARIKRNPVRERGLSNIGGQLGFTF